MVLYDFGMKISSSATIGTMKIFRLSLMLLTLPFLSGCLSMCALNQANHPGGRVVPDHIRHVEKAGISEDAQLLILFVGSITNSPRNSHYTLTVPLAQIATQAAKCTWRDTNGLRCALFTVPRSALKEGWPAQESLKDFKPVPLGSPITPPSGYIDGSPPEYFNSQSAKLLPNSIQTLYQVDTPNQMDFIFVDASERRVSTELHVDPVVFTPKNDWKYYFLLPVTVPLDVATAPVQIPCIIWIVYALGHSGC